MVRMDAALAAAALVVVATPMAVWLVGCDDPPAQRARGAAARITAPFVDNFDRAEFGGDWRDTGGNWRIVDGAVQGQGARNHPLWLRRRLPRDARIEFDAWSDTDVGDLKVGVWGDGESFARTVSYSNATSYVVIFGGWHNSVNVLARLDEHAADRRQRVGPRVVPGQRYHFQVERRARVLRWLLDGNPMLEWDDPEPLAGPGHEHFAFNNWETRVHFDNLRITPL